MQYLDLSFSTPAANLACDEALLDWREHDNGEEILRFWESPQPFVVVGYANKITTEVNAPVCETKNIPLFRRCSGGGTVLQGPGCLNYALILRIEGNPLLTTISSANKFIMKQNLRAIQLATGNAPSIQGHTDMVYDGKKFSGNSQRRHKNFLLFHGTFLLNFDLALIGDALKFPSRQPDYRNSRSHMDFLMNLNVLATIVKAAMRRIWNADSPLENLPLQRISNLAREKYETREWNLKL